MSEEEEARIEQGAADWEAAIGGRMSVAAFVRDICCEAGIEAVKLASRRRHPLPKLLAKMVKAGDPAAREVLALHAQDQAETIALRCRVKDLEREVARLENRIRIMAADAEDV